MQQEGGAALLNITLATATRGRNCPSNDSPDLNTENYNRDEMFTLFICHIAVLLKYYQQNALKSIKSNNILAEKCMMHCDIVL